MHEAGHECLFKKQRSPRSRGSRSHMQSEIEINITFCHFHTHWWQCCKDEFTNEVLADHGWWRENVWMTGLPDKYKARPNRPEFENMCMAEFASEYRIVYGDRQKVKMFCHFKTIWDTYRKEQGKPAVIRFARFSQQKTQKNSMELF